MRSTWTAAVLLTATVVVATSSASADPPPAATFHGLVPARIVETRTGPGLATIDGVMQGGGPLGPGGTIEVPALGRGGVPATGVGAVALNVTAINPTAASFVTVYPTGANRPNASNLNLVAGRTLPNMVIVPLGTNGRFTVYNELGNTNLAVDVLGWFPPQFTFQGLTPARLVETRTGPGRATIDGQVQGDGRLGTGAVLDVPIAGRGGVPQDGAGSVVLNVTAINPSAPSFLTVYPRGNPRPNASNLNLDPGRTLPNMVIVPLSLGNSGTGGSISIYNDKGDTDLAVDVLGWIPAGPSFTGLTPARLLDTRPNRPTIDGAAQGSGPLGQGAALTVPIAGRGGVPPTGAGAVALNVTAINPTAASFLTVYPAGANRPNASNLNLAPARTLPNMVIVPLSAGGSATVYNDRGNTHVAIDVLGWFPATANPMSTTRVSVNTTGIAANNNSDDPSISADGRYISFGSSATNLVSDDTNGFYDIFVHDRVAGETTLVSVATDGTQANGPSTSSAISADGRYVAFRSTATNLVPADTNGVADVFVHDRQTGTTTRVSVSSNGVEGNGSSVRPAISADGRYVAFDSSASNLVAGDTNGVADVFVHDRHTEQTTRVSVASDGTEGDNGSTRADISADGRFVAFDSTATNLVPNDTNGFRDVFVHDRESGTTTRASVSSSNQQGNSFASEAVLSADGRFVAFESSATNMVPGDTNGVGDVFVRDRVAGVTTRVSVLPNGTEGNASSVTAAISADGRYVAFRTSSSTLHPVPTNGNRQVFVHDRQTGSLDRVTLAVGGGPTDDGASNPGFSGDGRYIAFDSTATNIVAGDVEGHRDVFVHDQGTS